MKITKGEEEGVAAHLQGFCEQGEFKTKSILNIDMKM